MNTPINSIAQFTSKEFMAKKTNSVLILKANAKSPVGRCQACQSSKDSKLDLQCPRTEDKEVSHLGNIQ